MSPSEILMTPIDVATYLQKSKSWVYQACDRGALPHLRIGRDLRFKRSELDDWLSKQSVSHTMPGLKGKKES